MGVRSTFTMADVQRELQKKADAIHNKIIQAFLFVGERCLIEARTNKTYMDQTGNLTASMGYVVTFNGNIIDASGSNGSLGASKGHALASKVAANHTQGYCLVVVAGMNYAYAVEARGRNVLTSAEQLAEKLLPSLLKQLKIR